MKFPNALQNKLQNRIDNNSLRSLSISNNLIDFASNDYLGFSKNRDIFQNTHQLLIEKNLEVNGATGSRLLSGNHDLFQETEQFIANFHQAEDALLFNSGYDANVGFFSAVPQRNDIILYDELCHASIRDGIQMSLAKAYKFKHNDLDDLENLLQKFKLDNIEIYIVTESVFSMDGDSPDLKKIALLSEKYNALLVIDEAHALGVFGKKGEGLIQSQNLQDKVFARIMTFGKGLGCHGAVVLGSTHLKQYLINFCRSFIYTTALPPHAIATILTSYKELEKSENLIIKLYENSNYFNEIVQDFSFTSSIKSIVIPGNNNVKKAANYLQENGFNVKPILSPTVPEGQERLRFCLHSYNSKEEINEVLELLLNFSL
uniref:aminotransferase class I/II-fold pyridoxal phosphate-dependent enzyme n=1 Tax=Flavobacterium sp. TaxID=239 RepID=UPI00404A2BAB